MLPESLVVQFWLKVKAIAQERHGLKSVQADQSIKRYLELAEKHEFAEAIYHRGADEIADIIAHGAKEEFREPVSR